MKQFTLALLVASASATKLSTYGDCDWECGKTGSPEEQWRSYGYPHRGADLKKPLDNQQRWDTYLPDFSQKAACNCANFAQVRDGPAFFNEPPYTETSPSAAGFVQKDPLPAGEFGNAEGPAVYTDRFRYAPRMPENFVHKEWTAPLDKDATPAERKAWYEHDTGHFEEKTTAWAAEQEKQRVAGVTEEKTSAAWRGSGPKTPWEKN